jgi:hypothetical protein
MRLSRPWVEQRVPGIKVALGGGCRDLEEVRRRGWCPLSVIVKSWPNYVTFFQLQTHIQAIRVYTGSTRSCSYEERENRRWRYCAEYPALIRRLGEEVDIWRSREGWFCLACGSPIGDQCDWVQL